MYTLFLCPHGGAKSLIAAKYLEAAGFAAVAAAAEEPYDAVPEPVAEFLRGEGFDVAAFRPRPVERAELERAARVIAIDCDVPNAERWDDVPKVSEDLPGAAAAIRRHVEALVAELRG